MCRSSVSTESSNGDEEVDLPPTCGLMILKIIIVNILLSLGDQISDFLQVVFQIFFMVKFQIFFLIRFRMIECCCYSGIQSSFHHLDIRRPGTGLGRVLGWKVKAFHILQTTQKKHKMHLEIWWTGTKLELVLRQKVSVSLIRGKYGLCILLVNWSPGIIALLHMVAYHRYLLADEQLL